MAYPDQIAAAANPRKPPVGADKLHDASLLSMPRGRESEERKERRRAARNVIRHAVDASDRDLLLDAIGLTYEEAAPAPSRPIPAAAVEPVPEPVEEPKRCTRCREVKPIDSFPLRNAGTSQRRSHCRTCRSQYLSARRAKTKGGTS